MSSRVASDTNWKRSRRQVVVWLVIAAIAMLLALLDDHLGKAEKVFIRIAPKVLVAAVSIGLAIRAAREWGILLERSAATPAEDASE